MLDIINRYAHGFIAIPVILACKERGLFHLLASQDTLTLLQLVEQLNANSGHLQVAMRLLQSLNVVSCDIGGAYSLSDRSEFPSLIPDNILDLYHFPFDSYLNKDLAEVTLHRWIEQSQLRWGIEDAVFSDFLDGVMVIPILLTLKEHIKLKGANELFSDLPYVAQQELSTLFINLKWAVTTVEGLQLTDVGQFMADRALNLGTTASYAPMLSQLPALLFGDSRQVFERDNVGYESHVKRTLNVVASGFQHEKFFADTDAIIISLYNQLPFDEQPSYVVDMGCGDGTLLKRIYHVIRLKTARGQVLTEYPVCMVGVDYNQQSLDVTDSTLGEIPHRLLQGDISEPDRLLADLRAQGIDPDKILHVRSFLDHDRPFIAPTDQEGIQLRSRLNYQGVDVDRDGQLIPSHIAVQSLVEHLGRWASIVTRHGLLLLEVHSLSPMVVQKFLDKSESLHFDAYHAFSLQHLVEADVFLMAAAEVGLFCRQESFHKYPKTLPLTRITLNHFEKRRYQIRHATVNDIPNLLNCTALNKVASETTIDSLLQENVLEHLVLEYQGDLVAALLTEVDISTQGDRFSEVLKIREMLVRTDAENWQSLATDLLAFVEQWAIVTPGIKEIDGLPIYHEAISNLTLYKSKWNHISILNKKLVEKIAQHPLAHLEICELMAPEYELEAFAARWLLRIFQDMGVFFTAGESYLEPELISQLGISSRYHRLFGVLLQILQKRGVLERQNSRVLTLSRCKKFALQDISSEVTAFRSYFLEKYPAHLPWLTVVERCLKQYPSILRGEVDVNEVVFADGDIELFAGLFLGHRVADYFNELLADGVRWEVEQRLSANQEHAIRLLEIGAGTGGVTGILLSKLAPHKKRIEFWFTDVSSTFTRYGQKKFHQKYPWVKYQTFDIEKSLDAQGIRPESFDVVIANNVLHNTKLIHQSLNNTNSLLNKNGLLALIEFTQPIDILSYFGGLLQGFWSFKDSQNRLAESCLLSTKLWDTALNNCGFSETIKLGLPCEMHALSEARQSVIFGRKYQMQSTAIPSDFQPEITNKEKAEIDAPGYNLPEISSQVKNLEEECRNLLKPLLGIERVYSLSSDTPLMESGMDSLELLEFRAAIERHLGITLKSTFFFRYKTLKAVAEHLSQQKYINLNKLKSTL